ncbi:MAG: hypothetical protein U5R49_06650 [Deltaproteobacteria bacterium]|nr:hypothetical protein [Deltaproteobacteria bacterium]
MAGKLVSALGERSFIVLDAYFAVGPVFLILRQAVNDQGERLIHLITRAKNNVVAYEDPPPRTGKRGRPRKYGTKLCLMDLFESMAEYFEQATISLYGQAKDVSFLCLDLIWRPIGEKVRFVLVRDGSDTFILMCSDLTLSPYDIIRAYSYRFKIEVSFKVLKHLMGAFFYRFWTSVWPHIGTRNESDLSALEKDPRSQRLIREAADAIEAFMNFGCIATGILQILSLSFHEKIWQKYLGWLRTVTSAIPSEEVVVKSVIQQEYFHNFFVFRNSLIYRIIWPKRAKILAEEEAMAA